MGKSEGGDGERVFGVGMVMALGMARERCSHKISMIPV